MILASWRKLIEAVSKLDCLGADWSVDGSSSSSSFFLDFQVTDIVLEMMNIYSKSFLTCRFHKLFHQLALSANITHRYLVMGGVHFNDFAQQHQKTDREKSEMSRFLYPHSINEESDSSVLKLEAVESLLKEVLDRGLMEHGCPHYRRRCCIRAPCCNEIFGCHHCHNEAKNSVNLDQKQNHDIPRQKVEQVICLLCGTEQEIRQTCINCGVCMGKYFCEACKLFDDDTSKKQYHCDGCGICRIGGHENFFHCYKCGCCYSILLKNSHPCVEGAMHHDCPICFEYLFESRNDVTVLPCGHTIHQKCLEEMREHYQYACPLCSKSVCDMSKVWEKFDVEIAATPMPEPYQNRMVQILCNDCGKKSEVQYHVVAQKCPNCKSYNTRQTRG